MKGDELYINKETIQSYSNTNEELIDTDAAKVTGVIVELPGLGGSSCLGGSINMGPYCSAFARRCAENGIVLAYMFPGPWSWGDRTASRLTDCVVDAIADKYGLGTDFPLVVSGGSMGGQGALIYAADSRHKISAVASACPCCDVPDRFAASPSFPRTFLSAVAEYDLPFAKGLERISPIHRISDMPRVPYFICSDGEDEVFPEAQCDEYVEKMKAAGYDVTYRKQAGKRHGEFFPEVRAELSDFMVKSALGGAKETYVKPKEYADPLVIEEARRVGERQIRLYFSEPVDIIGEPFMGIRYTLRGTGVRREKINGVETVIQFPGTFAFEDDSHATVLWTMDCPNTLGVTTVGQVMERAGDLYAFDCPIKFCIEEKEFTKSGRPTNSRAGEIYNVVSKKDREKHLVPTERCDGSGWEGTYADIH